MKTAEQIAEDAAAAAVKAALDPLHAQLDALTASNAALSKQVADIGSDFRQFAGLDPAPAADAQPAAAPAAAETVTQ